VTVVTVTCDGDASAIRQNITAMIVVDLVFAWTALWLWLVLYPFGFTLL